MLGSIDIVEGGGRAMRAMPSGVVVLSATLLAFAGQMPAIAFGDSIFGGETSTGTLVQVAGCNDVRVVESQTWPEIAGTPISVSDNAPATIRSFIDTSGQQLGRELLPPSGWSPLTATDDELTYYGIPPRPTDASALANWTAEWSLWNPVRVTPCISTAPVVSQSSIDGANFAGVVDYGHSDYNHIYGRVSPPAGSTGPCSTSNSNSGWVGLGGDLGSDHLIQNGVVEAYYVPNAARMSGELGAFYEELAPGHQNPEVWLTPGFISPGDNVALWLDWLGGGGSYEYGFHWHDLTNGNSAFVDSNTAVDYYDGSTAEWVDEDQSRNGIDVRKYGSYSWWQASSRAGSTTNNAGDWSHHDLYSTGSTGRKTQDLAGSQMTSSSAFDVDWLGCN